RPPPTYRGDLGVAGGGRGTSKSAVTGAASGLELAKTRHVPTRRSVLLTLPAGQFAASRSRRSSRSSRRCRKGSTTTLEMRGQGRVDRTCTPGLRSGRAEVRVGSPDGLLQPAVAGQELAELVPLRTKLPVGLVLRAVAADVPADQLLQPHRQARPGVLVGVL